MEEYNKTGQWVEDLPKRGKNTILILIVMLFSFSSCLQSEEKKLNKLLLSGSIKPTSYRMNDDEQLKDIKSMSVKMRDGYYEIMITTTYGNNVYFTFKVENITANGKIIKGQISRVSMEQNDWAYIDDEAIGSIEADTENCAVKIEIAMRIYQNTVRYVIEF